MLPGEFVCFTYYNQLHGHYGIMTRRTIRSYDNIGTTETHLDPPLLSASKLAMYTGSRLGGLNSSVRT